MLFQNDKIMAMLFVTGICIVALFTQPEIAKLIISQVVTGIFAIVTGYQIGIKSKNAETKKEEPPK